MKIINKMKIVITHPHGNQNTSKTVSLIEKLNFLDSFWTTLALPFKLNIFKNKYYKDVSFKKIKINFIKEILRQICKILRLKNLYLHDHSIFSVNSIYMDLDMKVSKYLKSNTKNINIIYSYEDCALESFKVAKKNKMKTIYDLTSPYWRLKKKILEDEIQLQPEWKLSSTEIMTKKKCINKDNEIFLSDQIIVASSFTAKSLELFEHQNTSKIHVIPYGIDCLEKKIINKRETNEKLKLFFVGRPILSKGIQYVIQALNQIDIPWEIEIAGSIPESPQQISEKLYLFFKDPRCKFLGQISNENLLKRMKKSHVFLFTSLFEGFGQVLLEALSCSLPVITTYNTGGVDIIDHGKNGFLTPVRDTKKTIEILHNLYHNEEFRRSIAENAFANVNNFTWTKYQNALGKIIRI